MKQRLVTMRSSAFRSNFCLYGRASKVEEKEQSSKPEELVDGNGDVASLPFNGLVNTDDGNLFEKPVEIYDPTKELMDVPGIII